jgi:putative membrane protein
MRAREFGAKLKIDHAAQVAEIERMLKPLQVTIPAEPSAEAQTHHASLARLTGEQFDAAFLELLIASHTEAIEKYGAETHANPDRMLSDFASKSLPMLPEHLSVAESLR